jgi:hypothetical protein
MKTTLPLFCLCLILQLGLVDKIRAEDGVCPMLSITTASLPSGIIGQPYSVRLLSTGGVAPITWGLSRVADPLPTGLTLSPSGLISGTPQAYETKNIMVVAQDSCPGARSIARQELSIGVTSPATAELTITRLQLSFDNGRAETTVKRNQPGLRVKADLRFDGSGLLRGYWEVDGRMLAAVNEHLVYGKSLQLTSPAVPFLPTFIEGSHRVRLVIAEPALDIAFPEAIYFVTAEESVAGRIPIRIVKPRDHAELGFAPQAFNWEGAGREAIYLVELFERGDNQRIAAAYTKTPNYDLPEAILKEKFRPGKSYLWQIKSYDAEGNLVGTSEPAHFTFQSAN